MDPSITPVVNLGDVLSAGAMLLTLWRIHKVNSKRFNSIEFRVNLMWKRFARKFDLLEKIEDPNDPNGSS